VLVLAGRQTSSDHLDDSASNRLRHLLRKQGHARARRESDLAVIRLELAAQDSQQGRLASSVASQQADALAALDLTADAVQQRRTAKPNAQIVDGDKGHVAILAVKPA